jgi:hypothetical protein
MQTPDISAASALYRLGEAAVTPIEAALQDTAAPKPHYQSLYWIANVYAALRGEQALPLLRRLPAVIPDESFEASARNLTGYVSDQRPAIRAISCVRASQPRDAVDRVIVGWFQNNRRWLASGVEPGVKEADPAPATRGRAATGQAIGYRFAGDHLWAVPALPFGNVDRSLPPFAQKEQFAISTRFVDRQGEDCGAMVIHFRNQRGAGGDHSNDGTEYRVKRRSLPLLLAVLAVCAVR